MTTDGQKKMSGRVFITGGAGFIGRELAKKLVRKGIAVTCFDLGEQFVRQKALFSELAEIGDIRCVVGTILDRSALAQAIDGCSIVFHLAAMLGVKRTEENRLRCLEININGTDNVLDAAVKCRVEHVIVASSSEVYGEPARNPLHETDPTQGKTVYAVSKLAAEELTKGHSQRYPWLNHTIVRFFNTYGEGQVAQFVISRLVKQVLESRNPVIYGDGTQQRSFGHVDDVTAGLEAIMGNPRAFGQTYNLGNSNEVYTLTQLAQRVIDTLAPDSGLSVEVTGTFDGTDRDPHREIYSRYCATTKARDELGFVPQISIEEGIRRIAAAGEIHEDWPFNP